MLDVVNRLPQELSSHPLEFSNRVGHKETQARRVVGFAPAATLNFLATPGGRFRGVHNGDVVCATFRSTLLING